MIFDGADVAGSADLSRQTALVDREQVAVRIGVPRWIGGVDCRATSEQKMGLGRTAVFGQGTELRVLTEDIAGRHSADSGE